MGVAGYLVSRYGYLVPRFGNRCLDMGTLAGRGDRLWRRVPRFSNGETWCLDMGTGCLNVGTTGMGRRCLDMGTGCLNVGSGA